MKVETVREIQDEVRKLCNVVTPVNNIFDRPLHQMIGVMLHNIALNSEECSNYSLARDIDDIWTVCKALEELAEFKQYHYIQWLAEEFAMIVDGCMMGEIYHRTTEDDMV